MVYTKSDSLENGIEKLIFSCGVFGMHLGAVHKIAQIRMIMQKSF
jgi:hypothetical protein